MKSMHVVLVAGAVLAAVLIGHAQQVVNAPNVPVFVQSKGGGVGGADTQIQFNDAGAAGAVSYFTFDKVGGSNFPNLRVQKTDGSCTMLLFGNSSNTFDMSGCAGAALDSRILVRHIINGGGNIGTVAVASGFGTGPTVAGGDMAGRVTVGTVPGGSGVLNFTAAWTTAPACTANNETTANLLRATATTTQLTLTGTLTAADKLTWVCLGY